MFSSDQVFDVSGDFEQLEDAIRFAVKMFGNCKKIYYQITEDGKYCLGWAEDERWKPLPFDFDSHIIAEIVKQHLEKNKKESKYEWADGTCEDGFLMKVIPETFSEENNGIKHPFYGIVSIEYFENFYSK